MPCGLPDVGKGGTAVVIFAVCNNQKGSLRVFCAFDLVQTHLDRVEQRCQSVRGTRKDSLLESRQIGGEVFDELGPVGEFNEKVLVMRITCFQESLRGITRGRKLAGHAAGHVEDKADAQREIFDIKVFDLLHDPVFRQPEVAAVQTGNQPAVHVGNGGIHQDKIDIDFERLFLGFRYPMGA